jgi:hypothetical protein
MMFFALARLGRRIAMSSTRQSPATSLRISAADLKARFDAGEPVTILDTRSADAWNASREKLPGAERVDAHDFHASAAWPKDRLTVAYCT